MVVSNHADNKKPVNADCSALTEKIENNRKAPKFKLLIRVTK